ncbi:MAG: FAD-dependent monooxygenase [Salinibacterium sp.]|nr:FAD-dependent monooxygenase [Salinibacterium sp.]
MAFVDDGVIARTYLLQNLPAPWQIGRIVLLGDAAHTMPAHLASGGVKALEDAAVLYEELAIRDSLETALTPYGQCAPVER